MDESVEQTIIEEMKSYFGDRLVSIVLFGSQARGTANEHSDIDLVVIVDNIPSDWRQQRDIINKLTRSPNFMGLPISVILKSPDVVEASLDSVQPLLFGILKSYKALYDPEGFFETQAQIYRKHMEEWDVQEVDDHVWRVGIIAEDAKKRADSASVPPGSRD